MQIVDLRTENRISPINVDVRKPRFSWRAETEETNWYQKSSRIRVWKVDRGQDERLVWDSGLTEERKMTQVSYQGEPLESDSRYRWNVEVTAEGQTEAVISPDAWFETALFSPKDWHADWITENQEEGYHLYRKEFEAGVQIASAKLYVCGLGQHECRINGRAVTDAVLEPGWTDYHKSCLYSAYDVTGLLQTGINAVSIKVGDGMYRVPGGRYVYFPRVYGDRKLLASLRIIYEDGQREEIGTDGTWQTGKSPITFCCIYGGEDYDGRIPWENTSMTGFMDLIQEKGWEQARETEAPKMVLRAEAIAPMRVKETYQPVSVTKRPDGSYLYDLGKNFSGWVRVRIRTNGAMAGKKIVMMPSEILTPDGEPDQRVTGKGYAWTYICNEQAEQEFAPDFTYTGFRYVKVEGADWAGTAKAAEAAESCVCEASDGLEAAEKETVLPIIEAMTGEFIYPDLEENGSFSCSNELFNQIHSIIRQAMLSNIKSYFTDCPHREKLPWLEETHLIGPAMLCSFDLQSLYEKAEQDMADAQRPDGLVADICPEYVTGFDKWHKGFLDSPEWGSAIVLNPWHLYAKYGNKKVLEDWYPVMKKYTDYLTSKTWHGVLHHGLGDWLDIGPCTPYSQNTPVPVTATCIYYIDLGILEEAARQTGRTEDEEAYAEQRRLVYEEYNRQFLDDQTGRYANGSQACQAMSLMAGLVPAEYEEKAVRQLKDEVVKRSYAITAGDVGHPYLVAALMKYGMSDVLNAMTNITETPGYGYQVVNGATTLTEEWDGPDPKRPHGSQNHLMLGSIDEWFYAGLGGIGSIRTNPDFDVLTICPHPSKGTDSCSVRMKHPYGTVSVDWEREGDAVRVTAVIPPNTTARLCSADGKKDETVGSGTYTYMVSYTEEA